MRFYASRSSIRFSEHDRSDHHKAQTLDKYRSPRVFPKICKWLKPVTITTVAGFFVFVAFMQRGLADQLADQVDQTNKEVYVLGEDSLSQGVTLSEAYEGNHEREGRFKASVQAYSHKREFREVYMSSALGMVVGGYGLNRYGLIYRASEVFGKTGPGRKSLLILTSAAAAVLGYMKVTSLSGGAGGVWNSSIFLSMRETDSLVDVRDQTGLEYRSEDPSPSPNPFFVGAVPRWQEEEQEPSASREPSAGREPSAVMQEPFKAMTLKQQLVYEDVEVAKSYHARGHSSSDKSSDKSSDESLILSRHGLERLVKRTQVHSGVYAVPAMEVLHSRVVDFMNIEIHGMEFGKSTPSSQNKMFMDIFLWTIVMGDADSLPFIARVYNKDEAYIQNIQNLLLSSLTLYMQGKANIYNLASLKSLTEIHRLYVKRKYLEDFFFIRSKYFPHVFLDDIDVASSELSRFWQDHLQNDPYRGYVYVSLVLGLGGGEAKSMAMNSYLARAFHKTQYEVLRDKMAMIKELQEIFEGVWSGGMEDGERNYSYEFQALKRKYLSDYADKFSFEQQEGFVKGFFAEYVQGDSYEEDIYSEGLLRKNINVPYLQQIYEVSAEEVEEDVEALSEDLLGYLSAYLQDLSR